MNRYLVRITQSGQRSEVAAIAATAIDALLAVIEACGVASPLTASVQPWHA
jgi:hypothetical protein